MDVLPRSLLVVLEERKPSFESSFSGVSETNLHTRIRTETYEINSSEDVGEINFSVNQILGEIYFGQFRRTKSAVFDILGALNTVNLVKICIQRVQKFMKFKIQSL